jgi:hypothetical protein
MTALAASYTIVVYKLYDNHLIFISNTYIQRLNIMYTAEFNLYTHYTSTKSAGIKILSTFT